MNIVKELLRIAKSIIAGESNLGNPNNYWKVVVPFRAFILTRWEPSNAYYGSSRIFKPVYEIKTINKDSEIHNLHAGLFVVGKNKKVFKFSMTKYEFRPFERKFSEREILPLSNLVQISEKDARKPNYREAV